MNCLALFLHGLCGRELSWADRPSRCHTCGVVVLIGGVLGSVMLAIFGAGVFVGAMR